MKSLGRLGIFATCALSLLIAPLVLAGPPAVKAEPPSANTLPSSSQLRLTRKQLRQLIAQGYETIIWVQTTESRIPKRYIVRFNASGQLTTAQPLSIYFNNGRLQLYDADLIIARRP